jgi:flagellar FliJ protein
MAKAFDFRLEKLLELRRRKEEAARREVAAANQAVAERNRIILGLMTEEDAAKDEMRRAQQGTIDVERLRRAGEYAATLERRLQREYLALQDLVKEEMAKRNLLAETHKGVRVLERFRDRKVQLHRLELDREERRFLDEIGQNLAKGA